MLFCQAQMAKQQAQTRMTNTQLNNLEKDEEELKTKVARLEMFLSNPALNSIKELKVNLKRPPKPLQSNSVLQKSNKLCFNL